MALSLREIASASFRTSEEADAINTEFMENLGSRTRYLPARLAIGRSLRVPAAPPAVEQSGKVIKGETLLGPELGSWLAMLIEHDGREDVSLKGFQAIVAAHWSRGLGMLQRDWAGAGQDRDRLLRKLAEDAGLSPTASGEGEGDGEMPAFGSGLIQVPVGELGHDDQGHVVTWKPNAPAGSPHLALMGGSGKGKTRTIAAMLRGLREAASVPILAFDFKDDLTNKYNRLHEVFGAQIIGPPRQPIPLDVLHLPSAEPFDIKLAADRFCDSFSRLKGVKVGDRQKDALSSAAERAFSRTRPTRLTDIRDAFQAEYQRLGMKHDGAVGLLNNLCRYPLFEPLQTPADFSSNPGSSGFRPTTLRKPPEGWSSICSWTRSNASFCRYRTHRLIQPGTRPFDMSSSSMKPT